MDTITREDVAALLEDRTGPCVSLFMPAHPGGRGETREDPIRFKNLLRKAEDGLGRRGMSPPAIGEFVEPAARLRLDPAFWERQAEGLAVFLAPGFFRAFRLPVAVPERSTVSHRFHVRPLLSVVDGDGRFLVLAIGRNGIRLWRASRYGMDEAELPGVPHGLAETLRYDVVEGPRKERVRAPEATGTGHKDAVFRTQAFGAETDKANVLRYFQEVDRGLRPILKDERSPLVLAGVEYLVPLFREASSYDRIVAGVVTGSPDGWPEPELHRRAWALVQPVFETRRTRAAGEINRLVRTGRASRSLSAILPAASEGRVASLFVAVDEQRWGRYDREHGRVILHREEQAGDEDLLDLCAIQAWRHGGEVHAVERARIPGRSRAAALFRY